MIFVLVGVSVAGAVWLAFINFDLKKQNAQLSLRFQGLLDIEKAKAEAQKQLDDALVKRKTFDRDEDTRRKKLTEEYQTALQKRDHLKTEIGLLEENLEDISFGVYKPHFTFENSDEFKRALEALRDQERQLIRSNGAATCSQQWSVGGSKKDGERMTKQYTKIMLRAFNGECDAALSNVSWNNITKMEERVRKAYEAINELGSVMKMSISPTYLNAPELEGVFHKHFEDRRVNLVNSRKEFYAEIDLLEIELLVKERGLSAQFMKIPEAKEYRQTIALRAQKVAAPGSGAQNDQSLFAKA